MYNGLVAISTAQHTSAYRRHISHICLSIPAIGLG